MLSPKIRANKLVASFYRQNMGGRACGKLAEAKRLALISLSNEKFYGTELIESISEYIPVDVLCQMTLCRQSIYLETIKEIEKI